MPVSALRPLSLPAVVAARVRRVLRSLKFRIALSGMLTVALGIGLTTALLLQRAERDLFAAGRQAELTEVVRGARLLAARLRQLQQVLALSSDDLPTGASADTTVTQAFFDAKPVLRGAFASVAVAAPDGSVQALWDGRQVMTPQVSLAERAYFRTAVADGRPTVSGLIAGRLRAEPLVVLAQPVKRDGRVAAVLVATLDLRRSDLIGAITESGVEDAPGQLTIVTDAQGQILGHPERDRIGQPAQVDPVLEDTVASWHRMGQPLEPGGLDMKGERTLAVLAAVPGADWLVWRVRPLATVVAPLRAARAAATTDALWLMAASGTLLLALLWWLLRPLQQLRERSQHLFGGSLAAAEGWPQAVGEIGELARMLRDVAVERARLEAVNGHVIQRLQAVMATAPVGLAFTRNGHFELVSGELCRLLGRTERELLGQPARIIYASNEEYETLGARVAAAFAALEPFDGELQFRRGVHGRFQGRLRGMPVDAGNVGHGTSWSLIDVTDETLARQSLQWAASHDVLTGLANRQAFEQHAARLHGAMPLSLPAALLLLDLDRFKPINDRHGHAAGDAMLRAVASVLQAGVRGGDLAVRLGGDEFAVLLERCPTEVALRVAETLRHAIAGERVLWQGHSLSVGASFGVAVLDEGFATVADWVAAADRACYDAKAAGRDRVHAAGRPRVVAAQPAGSP